MKLLLFVMLGGALGSAARFLIGEWAARFGATVFPWPTFAVNAIGCFAIGVAAAWFSTPQHGGTSSPIASFVMVGILGGFTTFSAFSLQTLSLLRSGQTFAAILYAVASVAVCIVATWAGNGFASALLRIR